jgi:hypothetical protein
VEIFSTGAEGTWGGRSFGLFYCLILSEWVSRHAINTVIINNTSYLRATAG